ncbi:adenylate/guanylate cyclase domain-containing protein [Candidatus Aalborgicola defluviihabitans]|uniref:adenylate/guanylate cyclase domain-containing protein n=1 Tax=Candidatus Aalborgicola defluviihabitans TaxID=3386187 RepID=UPI001DB09BE5|nr:FHA domain-containing protein [Burkholderiales bacterium]
MGVQTTVVFTDLHGSTAVFEALGNALATETVTQITTWVGQQCVQAGGRLVKTLGDGVLVMFPDSQSAVDAVVAIQRDHSNRIMRVPANLRMPMRIGVASGEVEIVAGDCYGDAVNVAARLCDLCGPYQIWANAAAVNTVDESTGTTLRVLGPINIRGRAEPCTVYQIEWHEDLASDFMTMQGELGPAHASDERDSLGREVELVWMGNIKRFKSFELPIQLGRVRDADFVVNDPRVSRIHARLEWRNGSVVFVDASSYGSWIRFQGTTGSDVLLRREECVLHGKGELALGASFADASVPTVSFSIL